MSEFEATLVPLAIVGDGPMGLMLALFIDWHGVRSVLKLRAGIRIVSHCHSRLFAG
jgi:hypothetical protein